MKLKFDENMPAEAAELARDSGHDATTVAEEGLRGASDATIAARVQAERRALVTTDMHFANIRNYPPEFYSGIIVLRFKHQTKWELLARVREIAPLLHVEPLAGRLWIVSRRSIRVRGGPAV